MENRTGMQGAEMKNGRIRNGITRAAVCLDAAFGMFMCMGFYSCAADIGQRGAEWFLGQIFWIGVVALVIALIACFTKKAWVQGVIILVVGCVILFLVKNPDIFTRLGESIGNQIFN